MAEPGFNVHVDFDKPPEMEFNRRIMRRALVKIGETHMTDSRQLISRAGRSRPGENPARQTGLLAKSIGYAIPSATKKRAGLMVKIAPNQKRGRGKTAHIIGDFYPAFLFYGVRRGAWGMSKKQRRSGAHHKSGWRIAPRKNYMTETLQRRSAWTRSVLEDALRKSLRAVKK